MANWRKMQGVFTVLQSCPDLTVPRKKNADSLQLTLTDCWGVESVYDFFLKIDNIMDSSFIG